MTGDPDALVIRRLGRDGDGVADGPVFVPRTLPGEAVGGARAGGRISEPRILRPSPDRVAPPCPHFRRCGGCALQHASDAFVEGWKVARVRESLARVGIEAVVALAHVSPPNARRRAALKGRKTKRGALVGLHAAGSHDLVAIPDCRLLCPEIVAALPALEGLTRALAPRGAELGLHVTSTETGLDLAVAGAKAVEPAALAPWADRFARITVDGEPALLAARPAIRIGPALVEPPPGAFLQATAEGERALQALVGRIVGDAARVVDLFAGLGTFALPLARRARVEAWEGDPALVEALGRAAARAPGLRPVTARRRDLFRDPVPTDALKGADAAVIDPPRAGAAAQMAALAGSEVGRIASVSCDPDSFARDAGLLVAAGWRMGPVAVVDQFRWSPHVEVVAEFRRG